MEIVIHGKFKEKLDSIIDKYPTDNGRLEALKEFVGADKFEIYKTPTVLNYLKSKSSIYKKLTKEKVLECISLWARHAKGKRLAVVLDVPEVELGGKKIVIAESENKKFSLDFTDGYVIDKGDCTLYTLYDYVFLSRYSMQTFQLENGLLVCFQNEGDILGIREGGVFDNKTKKGSK